MRSRFLSTANKCHNTYSIYLKFAKRGHRKCSESQILYSQVFSHLGWVYPFFQLIYNSVVLYANKSSTHHLCRVSTTCLLYLRTCYVSKSIFLGREKGERALESILGHRKPSLEVCQGTKGPPTKREWQSSRSPPPWPGGDRHCQHSSPR